MTDNRNFLLAIALSITVIVAWEFFYAIPQRQAAEELAAAQRQTLETTAPAADSATVPGAPPAPATPGAAPTVPGTAPTAPGAAAAPVQAQGPRVDIDTPRVSGSIALTGARIDRIALKDYRVTVDRDSDNIELFAPVGSANPYYAEFGWVGAAGTAAALPTPSTVWTQEGVGALSPATPVTLAWDNGQGLTFRRRISVDEDYLFTVQDSVQNTGETAVDLHPYALISRHGTPVTEGYYILHEGMIGYMGDRGLQEVSYSTLDEEKTISFDASAGWLGITDKYWAAALLPPGDGQFTARFVSGAAAGRPTYQADLLMAPRTVAPGATAEATTRLFAGAKEVSVVDGYEEAFGVPRFELLIDWGWFYFITKPLFYVIDYFFRLFGNFGISILVVTVLIKTLFFPLASKSYRSMAKMKAVQPEMMRIRDRWKDDRAKQQQELMELYKKEKINPLAGCWPIAVQIPVFFALYKVLFVTIEMRHSPFFGWIRDLSAPDPTSLFNLFGLLPYDVPSFLLIGVWPILMGITMFLQMRMNPAPPDPTQAMIFNWMPVFFTFLLASFPAGLVIYWTWNNFLSICQQYAIMRRQGVKVELWDNLTGLFRRKAKEQKS